MKPVHMLTMLATVGTGAVLSAFPAFTEPLLWLVRIVVSTTLDVSEKMA